MALPAVLAGMARTASTAAEVGGATQAAASLGKFGKEVDAVGQIAQRSAPSVHMLANLAGKAVSYLTETMTLWIGTLKAAAGPVEQLVAIHNPARAEAFTRALNDAYGVIGRMLTPVLDAFTRSARKLGDFFAGLGGTAAPAMEAVAALVEHLVDKFVSTYQKNAPVFEAMIDVVVKFATAAMKVADVVFSAIGKVLQVANAVARLFGYGGESFDPKASAVGAAHRQARFVGPKQISDDAIKSSLMQGIGGEKKRDPVTALNDIANFTKFLKEWYERNGEELIGRAKRTAERGEKIASDPTYAGRQFLRWAAAKAGF